MSPLTRINEEHSIVESINGILDRYGCDLQLTLDDLIITESIVTDGLFSDAKLSNAITDLYWPPISPQEVYHFTSREAAEAIVQSGKFRLSNIAKRFTDGEIATFCQSQNLKGYLDIEANGLPVYKNLMGTTTFYASFAPTNLTTTEEEYFWSAFAACDGVRLKFRTKAKNVNFRAITYGQDNQSPFALLNVITEMVGKEYGRSFVLKGISTLCSFFLNSQYEHEKELRMLHRYFPEGDSAMVGTGSDSFLEVELGGKECFGYSLELLEIYALNDLGVTHSYLFQQRSQHQLLNATDESHKVLI